jgi:hypothetical protein
VDLSNGFGVEPRTFVFQVIARYASNCRVAKLHSGYRFTDPARLVAIKHCRLARVNLAKVATPGALGATNKERGLSVFPAFIDVRATGLLADGV